MNKPSPEEVKEAVELAPCRLCGAKRGQPCHRGTHPHEPYDLLFAHESRLAWRQGYYAGYRNGLYERGEEAG